MNSLGYSSPNSGAPQNLRGLVHNVECYLVKLEHSHLIIRNDQGSALLEVPFWRALLFGTILFPFTFLVAAGVLLGILRLEVKPLGARS